MKNIIKRTSIGIVIGIILVSLMNEQHAITSIESILVLLWCIGTMNSLKYHLSLFGKLLNPGLKLSVISYLSFGSGFLGFIPITVFVVYVFTLGWIYGLCSALVGTVKSIL